MSSGKLNPVSPHGRLWLTTLDRYAAGVMLDIAYGHSVSSVNDARIQRIDEAIGGILGTGNPGSMLVDFFPICEPSSCISRGYRLIETSEAHPCLDAWSRLEADRLTLAAGDRRHEP